MQHLLRQSVSSLAVALFALTALPAAPALAQDNLQGTLRYAIWSNPNGTFHPTLYFTDYDRNVIFNIYSRLYVLDENQNPVPDLASGQSYSEDGRTLTISLRDDARWHDGQPVTAEDVAFTYATSAHPDFPKDHPSYIRYVEGYEAYASGAAETLTGIRVIDAHTVSFTFTEPFAGFADNPVLPRHIWQEVPIAQWAESSPALRNPIGSGPFRFVEFVPDQYVILEANPDHYAEAPLLRRLIFTVTNAQTAQTALINGEIDIAELSSWNPRELQTYEEAGIQVYETTGTSGQYLTLDTTDARLSDVRVRQAIIHAINREAIVERLLHGHGVVVNTNAHPDSPYYPDDLNPYEYNPERARELLAEAGWSESGSDGILVRDGERFTFTLNFPTGNRTRELSAPIIQQNPQAVGIAVELISADFNSTLSIPQWSSMGC